MFDDVMTVDVCLRSKAVPKAHLAATITHCHIPSSIKQHLLREVNNSPRSMLASDHFVAIFASLDGVGSARNQPEVRHFRSRVAVVLQRLILHRYFAVLGCLVVAVNVLIITVELAKEYERVRSSSNTYLGTVLNLVTLRKRIRTVRV